MNTFRAAISSFLDTDEIIEPSTAEYHKNSQVWASHKFKHPQLVVRPKSLESLSNLLKILNDTDVDFAIRGGGCGSVSTPGVLISMSAFDDFVFTKEDETVTIGAGQLWRDIDQKLEEIAPEYSVPGARCTYVGVGGGTLQGGVSWMSSEYGLTSDPQNMLDAQIVLMSGEILWASTDPDLLWALRGGGGAFGAVTAFKLRAYKYPQKVYSGMILYPGEALEELSKKVPHFADTNTDPKVAMHFYCLDMIQGALVGKPSVPGLAVLVYDAHGEEHGRKEAFKWALEIPGAMDTTKGMSYKEVNELNDAMEQTRAQITMMMTAVVIPVVTEDLIKKTFKWYEDSLAQQPKLNAGTFVLIELMQKEAFNSVKSRKDTGWPRPNGRHILQLGTGALKDSGEELHKFAVKRLADAASEILDDYKTGDCMPRDFEGHHEPEKIFGENVERLRAVKKRVDPNNRIRAAYTL
ncbi:FAD-binding domain-containing protein [Pleomassaria siparia CBS 279.74]|uniref:FAD-binding domain-containing protein n=1 Tax=Pleomassaria siparia CBS 279.74 TaxID=1314801 RepID=A0A6G1KGX5_9PLEO|nr:FAD-binding domain-containing protein [Pleomassaria siparia CBS 279.74]